MATGLLPAVGGPDVHPGVAGPADHLVTVVLLGKDTEGGLDHPTPQPQHQVQGGLLLYVVVRQSPAILQLLSSKDKTLLIRRNSFLVLKKKQASISVLLTLEYCGALILIDITFTVYM